MPKHNSATGPVVVSNEVSDELNDAVRGVVKGVVKGAQKEQGAALIIVLLLLGLMSVLVMSIAENSVLGTKMQNNTLVKQRDFLNIERAVHTLMAQAFSPRITGFLDKVRVGEHGDACFSSKQWLVNETCSGGGNASDPVINGHAAYRGVVAQWGSDQSRFGYHLFSLDASMVGKPFSSGEHHRALLGKFVVRDNAVNGSLRTRLRVGGQIRSVELSIGKTAQNADSAQAVSLTLTDAGSGQILLHQTSANVDFLKYFEAEQMSPIDTDGDHVSDYFYFGDTQGQLHRIAFVDREGISVVHSVIARFNPDDEQGFCLNVSAATFVFDESDTRSFVGIAATTSPACSPGSKPHLVFVRDFEPYETGAGVVVEPGGTVIRLSGSSYTHGVNSYDFYFKKAHAYGFSMPLDEQVRGARVATARGSVLPGVPVIYDGHIYFPLFMASDGCEHTNSCAGTVLQAGLFKPQVVRVGAVDARMTGGQTEGRSVPEGRAPDFFMSQQSLRVRLGGQVLAREFTLRQPVMQYQWREVPVVPH